MRKALILAASFATLAALGDQVEMKNGDHYSGRVLSLTSDSVVLQSDILGKVTLPRAKVALLNIGSPASVAASAGSSPTTNRAPVIVKSNAPANTDPDIGAALRHLGANTNFIAQIRGQFLSDAGPAANQKFDDTLRGLMSGDIDLVSLRAQAKSAADQLRNYQKELGPDAGDTFNSYLAILDNFVKESSSATNR